jgi:ABC-2 type transport system ATP-binding protein
VVILSTHIVEDVSDLCAQVAIMAKGRIIQQGTPEQLIQSCNNKLWQLDIDSGQLPQWQSHPDLISRRLSRGVFNLTFYNELSPSPDAKLLQPSLEDVYFSVLAEQNLLVR